MNAIIAALLLVFLAASSGETNAFAEAGVSEASVAIVATHNKAQNQTYAQARDDAQGQAMMAAIEPAKQAIKSPSVAEPFGLSVVPVATGELLTQWSSVEADIRAESKILAECRASVALCPLAARNLLAIVAEGRAHTGRARIISQSATGATSRSGERKTAGPHRSRRSRPASAIARITRLRNMSH